MVIRTGFILDQDNGLTVKPRSFWKKNPKQIIGFFGAYVIHNSVEIRLQIVVFFLKYMLTLRAALKICA